VICVGEAWQPAGSNGEGRSTKHRRAIRRLSSSASTSGTISAPYRVSAETHSRGKLMDDRKLLLVADFVSSETIRVRVSASPRGSMDWADLRRTDSNWWTSPGQLPRQSEPPKNLIQPARLLRFISSQM